jgi:predicted hydrocarbon binding protein
MKLIEFENHLKEINFDKERMKVAIDLIKELCDFLEKDDKKPQDCGYEDLYAFSERMIKNKINEYDNYIHILRYAKFINNEELTIATMEIVDGAEMMENFSQRLERRYGKLIRDTVFWDIGVPPLGMHPKERPKLTMTLIERLIENIGESQAKKFLNEGLRDQYTDWYKMARDTYLEAGTLDNFLEIKRQDFQHTLKKHMEEKSLFFTQIIDDEVINYVNEHPTVESGIRDGNILSVSKIPYMTKQFLDAKRNNDSTKMKYYYCHNPWFREGIKDKDVEINPICCQISCGYYKDYWEGVLDSPVEVELTGSVLLGDESCNFDIRLPDDVV